MKVLLNWAALLWVLFSLISMGMGHARRLDPEVARSRHETALLEACMKHGNSYGQCYLASKQRGW
jgi:hypothetical protein